MDVSAYWALIKRQRKIVVGGIAVACLLGFLGLVKISGDGVGYRTPRVYDAKSTVFVTQAGFPWGRSTLDQFVKGKGAPDATVPRFSDPNRMEYLASLYSSLALSDPIKKLVTQRFGALDESKREELISSTVAGSDQRALPIFQIQAFSTSADRAQRLALVAAKSVRDYITREQLQAGIAKDARIQLQIVKTPGAEVFEGVKLTTPVMLFLLAMIVTTIAAFVRDNHGRGREAVDQGTAVVPTPEAAVPAVTKKPAPRRKRTAAEAPPVEVSEDDESGKTPVRRRRLAPVASTRASSDSRKRPTELKSAGAQPSTDVPEAEATELSLARVAAAPSAGSRERYGEPEAAAEPEAARRPWRAS